MRWVALACLCAAGCDRLFALQRLPEIPVDAAVDAPLDGIAPPSDGEVEVDGCPAGFTRLVTTGSSYQLVPLMTDWTTALVHCQQMTAGPGRFVHLAVFSGAAEYAAVQMLPGFVGTPWVGGMESDPTDAFLEFTWITNEPVSVAPWDVNQPDNANVQNCALMRNMVGMDNVTCSSQNLSVCECDAYPQVRP